MGRNHPVEVEQSQAQAESDISAGLSLYRETRLQACLHARHQIERTKVIAALQELSGVRWLKQARRVTECCSHGRIFIRGNHQGGSVGLWISRCGHRCCPFCSSRRSRRVEGQIRSLLANYERPRHVVLTQRHSDMPLSDQIAALRDAWKRLRLSAWGKRHFFGGIYVVEVKLAADGRWHPHLHIVYDGLFIDQRALADKWGQVADGSRIVWISAARSGHGRYLAKYVGKPAELDHLDVGKLAEYIQATHGLRMVQPWGTAHGPTPSDGDPLPPPPPADSSIPLEVVARKAAAGHVGETVFLRALAARWPILRAYARAYVDLDDPPDDIYSEDWRTRTEDELSRCLKFIMPLFSLYKR